MERVIPNYLRSIYLSIYLEQEVQRFVTFLIFLAFGMAFTFFAIGMIRTPNPNPNS